MDVMDILDRCVPARLVRPARSPFLALLDPLRPACQDVQDL